MDAGTARLLNSLAVTVFAIGFAIALWRASRPESGYTGAFRWAERAEIPLTEELLRRGVVARFHTAAIAQAVAGLTAAAVSAPFLLTPLADGPLFLFAVMFPAVLLSVPVAALAVTVRERLFTPAPDAIRVARAQEMRTADYLGPVRRGTTWVVAAAGAVILTILVASWVRTPERIDSAWAITALALGAMAAAGCALLPRLERMILDRPQPATGRLDLAWDDSLRTGALATLRLSLGMVWVVASAAAVGAIWPHDGAGISFLSSQVVVWGQVVLVFMYPSAGFRLRPALRPAPEPLPAGSAA